MRQILRKPDEDNERGRTAPKKNSSPNMSQFVSGKLAVSHSKRAFLPDKIA
jgi:hypothetical protein